MSRQTKPSEELANYAESCLTQLMSAWPLLNRPAIHWKGLRVTAGQANYPKHEIVLSRIVLQTEDEVFQTLLHEYAHLLTVQRHGQRAAGHGREWKAVMVELGAEPKRTHNYTVKRNEKRNPQHYRCSKCGYVIERSRRFRRGRIYLHVGCGGVFMHQSNPATSGHQRPRFGLSAFSTRQKD